MLESPKVNIALSSRGGKPGIDHLGIQTDTEEELAELKARARSAGMAMLDEGETSCCYARSDKYWVTDPDGVAWEQFHTLSSIPTFNAGTRAATEPATACCAGPAPQDQPVGVPAKAATSSSCC